MAGPIAYYEVRWRPSDSDGEWMYRTFPPESTTVQITNVDRSKSYVIEARSVGPSGLKSIWVNISHTVEGNAVPEVPGALSAVGTADAVKLAWTFALPMPADTMVCIERATSAGGPWTEIVRVRALSHIVTEKVDGTFYYRARTVNFRGDFSGYSAVVSGNPETVAEINASISTALNTAQNAQATADGKIQTFWQPAAPVIGPGTGEAKVGDIWFDTDDGNKIWRVVGSSWTKADDDDMAQAIILANNAQTTADGKVEMFVGSTAPTSGMNLSDLWFDTVNKALFRWDGAVWTNRIADVTADQIGGSGVNLVPDKWSTAESTNLPAWAVNAGTISRVAGPISGGQWRITATGINAYAEPSGSDGQFPIDRTKKYLLSAYVTSSAAIGPGGIAMALRTQPGSGFTASDSVVGVAANVRTRVYAVIDGASTPAGATTASVFILFNSSANGQTIDIDGYMVEELIGNKITPSSYSRGSAAGQSLTALIAAQNAQATADGVIDIYRQPTAPAGAKLGDYWQDSDDGRWWYYNGSSWGESPDNRLPQVVIDAANAQSAANTAQTTANARIRLFVQEAQPTGGTYIVGDQWFVPSTSITRYWNGSGWSLQADNSNVSQDPTVVNRSFEQGLEGWAGNGGDGFSVITDAASINGTKVLQKSGGSAAAELYNNAGVLSCNVNDRITGVASFKHNGGVVGTAHLIFHFYDTGGSYLGARWGDTMVTTASMAAQTWKVVRDTISCPTGTARCRIGIRVTGYTSGAWYFDQVGLAISTRSLADANEGVPSTGRNAIHNGNFSVMHAALGVWVPNGEVPYQNWKKLAGTVTGGGNASLGILTANAYGGWSGYQPQININAPLSIPNGNSAYSDYLEYTGPLAFVPGQVVRLRARVWINHSMSLPAGLSTTGGVQLVSYDASGAYLGIIEALATVQGHNGVVMNSGTIPAGAAKFRVLVQARIANTSGSTYTLASGIPVEMVVDDIEIITVANMDDDATHGTVYGKTSNEDLYDTGALGYARRIGLNVKGSRKILGGARNSRASLVAGVTSVRTTTALSASSAGTVTVNAHSIEISGETVTYNGVTNAVTGLTQGVTYTIFTIDPYLDGGTRTYYAQTSVLSMQQAGEGCIHIGNITIPTSGSSSGGSSGTGDPNDWCVAVDMHMPDGRHAFEVEENEFIECWDELDPPDIELLPVESNELCDGIECIRIETESGAAVVASVCTPMTLRDLSIRRMPDMLGEEVLVRRSFDEMTWERVVKLEYVGKRTVAKIKVHQRCYFAGESPEATIATHNATQKP